jgi:TM2 domain-containing membrane protein YozV
MYTIIGADGAAYGPVDLNSLRVWISQGRVRPETMVVDPISQQQRPAGQLPELAQDFQRMMVHFAPPVQPGPGFQAPGQLPPPGGPNGVQVNNYIQMPMAPAGAAFPGQKSRLAAGLFALFFGTFGVHQFYLGKTGPGLAMLLLTVLTCGYGAIVTAVWALVDTILIFVGATNDSNGLPLS